MPSGEATDLQELHPPSLAEYEASLRRIALELEKLGIASGSGRNLARGGRDLASLTPREWEIVESFREGRGIAEIAERSHISQHTVRNHFKSIRRKLGVRSQIELLHKLGTKPGDRGQGPSRSLR